MRVVGWVSEAKPNFTLVAIGFHYLHPTYVCVGFHYLHPTYVCVGFHYLHPTYVCVGFRYLHPTYVCVGFRYLHPTYGLQLGFVTFTQPTFSLIITTIQATEIRRRDQLVESIPLMVRCRFSTQHKIKYLSTLSGYSKEIAKFANFLLLGANDQSVPDF